MFVRRVALVSAVAAPVLFVGGQLLGEAGFPGYDPISQTISELAALDAPPRVLVTIAFVLTSLCHMLTALFSPAIGLIGRLMLGVASVATFSVAMFPLPSVAGTSLPHRLSAMVGFVLLAAWPAFGMRPRGLFPWIVRPPGGLLGTSILAALCVWFLVVWQHPELGYVGVVERLAADTEAAWPALVVLLLWRAQRVRHAALSAEGRLEDAVTPG